MGGEKRELGGGGGGTTGRGNLRESSTVGGNRGEKLGGGRKLGGSSMIGGNRGRAR